MIGCRTDSDLPKAQLHRNITMRILLCGVVLLAMPAAVTGDEPAERINRLRARAAKR